jgi:hypothetical protein
VEPQQTPPSRPDRRKQSQLKADIEAAHGGTPLRELLYRWRWIEHRSLLEISQETGAAVGTVARWMGEYGLLRRVERHEVPLGATS